MTAMTATMMPTMAAVLSPPPPEEGAELDPLPEPEGFDPLLLPVGGLGCGAEELLLPVS